MEQEQGNWKHFLFGMAIGPIGYAILTTIIKPRCPKCNNKIKRLVEECPNCKSKLGWH